MNVQTESPWRKMREEKRLTAVCLLRTSPDATGRQRSIVSREASAAPCRARGTSTCPSAEMRLVACGLLSDVVGEIGATAKCHVRA